MATETNVSQLVINKLTQAQYKEAKEAGQIVETELYMVTDGGTSEAVQPDWNQNDETALDYVKNRTHWTETENTPLIENMTLTFTDGNARIENTLLGLSYGEKYRVIWDGVEQILEASEWGVGFPCLYGSNFEIVDWINEYYEDDELRRELNVEIYAYAADEEYETGTTTHTLSVYQTTVTIHKLDQKYLPNSVVRFNKAYADSNTYYVADKTYAEVATALSAGGKVIGLENIGEDYPNRLLPVTNYFLNDDYGYVEFTIVSYNDDNYFGYRGYRLLADDTVELIDMMTLATDEDVDNAAALFVVRFSYDDTNSSYVADKDQLEIDVALDEGKVVIGVDNMGYLTLTSDMRGSGYDNTYIFIRADASNGCFEQYEMYGGGVGYFQMPFATKQYVDNAVEAHDNDTSAHADIRTELANKAPMYTYGTEDLVAGSSPLETGKLYFVYE